MTPTLLAVVLTSALPLGPELSMPREAGEQFAGGEFLRNQQEGFGGSTFGVPVKSTKLIVVAPKSEDSLAAWSSYTGVWKRIPIKPQDGDAVVPIVGSSVAAVRVGKMVYGYGAEAGRWHWIETDTRVQPTVGTSDVTIRDGDWYYALSSKSGKWSGLNLDTGEIR
ncbi:MAG: hypothetical protein AB8G99_18500 [Planctomycetaceae bacterium]